MGKPYRFTGDEPRDYPTVPGLGTVQPDAIAYFELRAPDDRWELVEPQGDDGHDQADEPAGGSELPAQLPGRPAANAAKPDWQAYVAALGEPAEAIEGKTTKDLQARADQLEAAAVEAAAKAAEGGDGGAA